jgi:hypothetical protein
MLEITDNLLLPVMYDYPYPTNTFDLTISHAALHHGFKAKVISLIEKIQSQLAINGKFFVSLPRNEGHKPCDCITLFFLF